MPASIWRRIRRLSADSSRERFWRKGVTSAVPHPVNIFLLLLCWRCLLRSEFKSTATAARSQEAGPAATLRSRTAGSQDESRCSAIHKFIGKGQFNGNVKGARLKERSRRPLQRRKSRRDAGATTSKATSKTPA